MAEATGARGVDRRAPAPGPASPGSVPSPAPPAPAPPAPPAPKAAASRTARAAGRVLGVVTSAVHRLRDRPLHPRGTVLRGVLRLDATDAPAAAALGAPATRPVLVRSSRSAGLPAPLPDVMGLAVRWTDADGTHDLLLSSTGLGRLSRFVLAPRLRPLGGGFGSLMPFRDLGGRPVLLAAVPADSRPGATSGTGTAAVAGAELVLLSAHPGGAWHRIGRLRIGPVTSQDAPRLDPVRHAPGRLGTYPWTAALRAPSYAAARDGRPSPDRAE